MISLQPCRLTEPSECQALVDFAVRAADNTSKEEVAQIDLLCFAPEGVLAKHGIKGKDFPVAGRFTVKSLELDFTEDKDFLIFRFLARGKTAVALDYIDIVALPPKTSTGK